MSKGSNWIRSQTQESSNHIQVGMSHANNRVNNESFILFWIGVNLKTIKK